MLYTVANALYIIKLLYNSIVSMVTDAIQVSDIGILSSLIIILMICVPFSNINNHYIDIQYVCDILCCPNESLYTPCNWIYIRSMTTCVQSPNNTTSLFNSGLSSYDITVKWRIDRDD